MSPGIFILNTMAQAGISRFRHLIRTLTYFVSTHAAEELEDDHFTVLDLENIILTGQVAARQRNSRTREIKYVIEGTTFAGDSA